VRRDRPDRVHEIASNGGSAVPLFQDTSLYGRGTRFRIYPQPRFLAGFETPETVWLSPPAGSLVPGPADRRMYVVDAIDKKAYGLTEEPPYRGPAHPAVAPDPDGHFDHLDPDNRAFGAAHMFAGVRRVLDIWEGYLGRSIEWHFRPFQERLELIPYVDWNNAQAGFGFLETGLIAPAHGDGLPFCLNFDVLAHETGHLIVFSLLGIPDDETLTASYLGFHESCSDLVALISVLHFDSFMEHLLGACHGNLAAENELNRLIELSPSEQIRHASHATTMRDVPFVRLPWQRLSQPQRHRIGEPMTGAVFDILVEVFQALLVERGVIDADLAATAERAADTPAPVLAKVQTGFDRAYDRAPEAFQAALVEARDIVGLRLARTWDEISQHRLRLADVAAKFLSVDRSLSGPRFQRLIRDSFLWRSIVFGIEEP
jgi:hypothetical protein